MSNYANTIRNQNFPCKKISYKYKTKEFKYKPESSKLDIEIPI